MSKVHDKKVKSIKISILISDNVKVSAKWNNIIRLTKNILRKMSMRLIFLFKKRNLKLLILIKSNQPEIKVEKWVKIHPCLSKLKEKIMESRHRESKVCSNQSNSKTTAKANNYFLKIKTRRKPIVNNIMFKASSLDRYLFRCRWLLKL